MAKRIVLDTNVARDLCYGSPKWVSSFVNMKKNEGWTFHLSDVAVTELVAQFERGSISNEQWSNLIRHLNTFLSDWLPCLPGKRQLFVLCGFEDSQHPKGEKDTANYQEAYSKAVWQTLQQMVLPLCEQKIPVFEVGGKIYKCPLKPSIAGNVLKNERENWIKMIDHQPRADFNYTNEVKKIKGEFDSWELTKDPPMSIRGDILVHALAEMMMKCNNGYSPSIDKNSNDGIDFLLSFPFMWPSLLVTRDKKLYSFFRKLPSYQAGWTYCPEELANSWENKSLIEPIFNRGC